MKKNGNGSGRAVYICMLEEKSCSRIGFDICRRGWSLAVKDCGLYSEQSISRSSHREKDRPVTAEIQLFLVMYAQRERENKETDLAGQRVAMIQTFRAEGMRIGTLVSCMHCACCNTCRCVLYVSMPSMILKGIGGYWHAMQWAAMNLIVFRETSLVIRIIISMAMTIIVLL